ncbi:MAG: alkylmercury lyase [Bacteroidales bacterium]|nr:alkylmercury lyase [Bacteroidales bacterium]
MIEFQLFTGCPNADDTLANLRAVMAELGIPEHQLKISVVPDLETAKRLSFQGSPSILVNGVDICTGMEPTGFSYGCRIYKFEGRQTGVIPKDYIRERLVEY